MTDNDAFRGSVASFDDYPKNLVHHNTYYHILQAYADRLTKEDDRLFCNENETDVELWEYKVEPTGFVSCNPKTLEELRTHVAGLHLFAQDDPQCRFMFVYAGHSRAKLRITKTMLTTVLTYHQAMAPFVDFLFSFGKQKYPRDFHFSGVYHESHFTNDQQILNLPDLGRSGKDFQLCYNLKSAESSGEHPRTSWSVRILAVLHSFDVVTGKSFWTIVKGDELIKKRIKAATSPTNPSHAVTSSSSESFCSTLAIHLIIFDWCREEWRWYISYLEDLQETITRRALSTSFDRPSNQTSIHPTDRAETSTPGKLQRTVTQFVQRVASATGTLPPPLTQASSSYPAPPPREYEPDLRNTEIFSISDLQSVTHYEEKFKELLLVIRSNIKIVTDVQQYYLELVDCPEFPDEIKLGSKKKLREFEKTVASIINDLEMQYSRADNLLSTLTNRKALLNGILDYRSMEASKRFAENAEASTREMQIMTEEMNTLAQKTKQETVSMRIITLVTLFFLPGTFISTIMSTDILQYSRIDGTNSYEEDYSSEALKRYVSITIPLMAVTFAAWYIMYFWIDRRQHVKSLRRRMEKILPHGGSAKV
ncbi:uncharacterized protein PAC_06545 [Phialocephala subalpina]|uniref:CorA-like transporter domain-containing protein n=1 Tax=Phialocephala subalpina TaxID=576137 RepID=A0A1L7WV52_9HELO|nr:uncharacterized protein PAC_06545 [Phialocephala subalpina]